MNTFVICDNEEDFRSHMSHWGNFTFELSAEDIVALFAGKTLTGDIGEYGIFIKMGE